MVVIGGNEFHVGSAVGRGQLNAAARSITKFLVPILRINTSDLEMAFLWSDLVAVMIFSKSKQLQRVLTSMISKKPPYQLHSCFHAF